MSHDWSCPDNYEIRQEARRDAESDINRHRWQDECDDANEMYEREFRHEQCRIEEEQAEERRIAHQREMRQEEEYILQQQEYEYYAQLQYEHDATLTAEYEEHMRIEQEREEMYKNRQEMVKIILADPEIIQNLYTSVTLEDYEKAIEKVLARYEVLKILR